MKKILYILILSMSITLCGCWGYTDLKDLRIIYGISFDLNQENEFIMTTESVSPNGNKDGDKQISYTDYHSAVGKSIFDAARNMTKNASGKRTFYQTCQVISIGKGLCETSVTPVIDFFTRDPKRRSTNYPVIFEEEISDVISKNRNSVEPLSSQLIGIIKLYRFTGYAVDANLAQTVSRSKSVTNTMLLNKFKFVASKKLPNSYEPTLDGTGVFYKNKLVGYLTPQETMVANIISKKIKNVVLIIKKDNNEGPYKNISVELSNFKIKIVPAIENDQYIMNVNIKSEVTITEYFEDESLKKLNYDELENLISKSLTDLINDTYLKCRTEFKVDALDFGNYFAQKYKSVSKMQSEKWNDIFCNRFILKINVKTNIKSTGSTLEKSD